MEMPSSENAEHSTVISNDGAGHPTIVSNDAADHPTVVPDAAEDHLRVVPDVASEHPPVIPDAAPEHPTVIPDGAAEHPTVIPDGVAEHPISISNDAEYHLENMVADVLDHGMEIKHEIDEDEVNQTLEAIASTGKFWHDWEKLRSMLSFQLKQVLLEYPEAKVATEEQSSSLGETFGELEKRLDEELFSFVEGPPFTLQRLCEILLAARSIYPKLSKLALALEKNLLVTSTLPVSTAPYPQTSTQTPDKANISSEEPQVSSGLVQNGVEPVTGDRDEIMEEATEIDEEMLVDDMAVKA